MKIIPTSIRRWTGSLICVALLSLFVTIGRGQQQSPPGIHGMISSYDGASTCLVCHGTGGLAGHTVEADFMKTIHWTWGHTNTPTGQAEQVLGKKNVINNYCIAVSSNEPRCTSCHAGVGWRDDSFDFTDENNIDCLVCHDTTGTYQKNPMGAGAPVDGLDLLNIAQNAGKSSRTTCGACHFYGGGGDAVKHGDLDSTMTNPTRELDVHMGTDGMNKSCAWCHKDESEGATSHDLVGSRYSKPAPDNWLCQSCHTDKPHHGGTADNHTSVVACQTCHVPEFARGGKATKMTWDWSTAGNRNEDGSDRVIKDAEGNAIYHSKKGSFVWEANVVPEYVWFNGDVVYTTLDDTVDPSGVTTMNKLQGAQGDERARIFPVKHFRGRQPFDAGNNTLAVPHLFPYNSTDTTAYWKGYNWTNSLIAGMEAVDRGFSGEVGWLDTEMFWIENHMVAPKERALTCTDCHVPGGRLDFLALGYPADRAARLQTLAGFEIAIEADGGTVTLSWTGTPGYKYQIMSTTNPSDPASWKDEPDGEILPGDTPSELTWSDELGAGKYFKIQRTSQ